MPAYSKKPLSKKLGIKEDFKVLPVNSPKNYLEFFPDWPEAATIVDSGTPESIDFIHLFCLSNNDMILFTEKVKPLLKKNGILWVSWPKGASGIKTDLKRDPIRDYLLSIGLVDTKVASIDDTWSGLKFVYRLKDR